MMTLLKINRGDYSIVQVTVDGSSEAVNKAVKDLTVPVRAVLISVFRGNEVIIPRGETVIKAGDKILALADKDAQAAINALFGS
jgi:trk system potassium uptake protein TrkA